MFVFKGRISGKRGRGEAKVSESELILNRAGRIGILREDEKEALTILPKHRKHLTTDWPGRKNCICCYPAHQGLKKRLSLPRRVNAKISAEIFVEFKEIVPIGAGEWRLLFIHLVNSRVLTCCLGYGKSDTCGSLDCSFTRETSQERSCTWPHFESERFGTRWQLM